MKYSLNPLRPHFIGGTGSKETLFAIVIAFGFPVARLGDSTARHEQVKGNVQTILTNSIKNQLPLTNSFGGAVKRMGDGETKSKCDIIRSCLYA